MTRPSDISTKAIACRVPMQDYIKFLTEASNKGMSISEWLLMKVYSGQSIKGEQKASKSTVAAKEKEIDKLQKQIAELTKEKEEMKRQKQAQEERYQTLEEQLHNLYLFAKSHKEELLTGEDMIFHMSRLFPNALLD